MIDVEIKAQLLDSMIFDREYTAHDLAANLGAPHGHDDHSAKTRTAAGAMRGLLRLGWVSSAPVNGDKRSMAYKRIKALPNETEAQERKAAP